MTRSSTNFSCSDPPKKTKQDRMPTMISPRTMDKVKPPFAERYPSRFPSRSKLPPGFTSVQESPICTPSSRYRTPAIANASDTFTASYTCDLPPGFKSRQSSMTLIPQPVLHRIDSFAHGTSNYPEPDLSLEARGEVTSTPTSSNDRAFRIPRCINSDYGAVHTSQAKSSAITSSGDMKQTAFPPRVQKETTTNVFYFHKDDNSLSAATDKPRSLGEQATSQHTTFLPRITPQRATASAEASQAPSVAPCHMTVAPTHYGVPAASKEPSVKPGAMLLPPDKSSASDQCASYPPITTSICNTSQRPNLMETQPQQLPPQHQKVQHQLHLQLQRPRRRLRHNRRRRASPKTQMQQERHERASQLNPRRTQVRRVPRNEHHQGPLQHDQSRLRLLRGQSQRHRMRRRKGRVPFSRFSHLEQRAVISENTYPQPSETRKFTSQRYLSRARNILKKTRNVHPFIRTSLKSNGRSWYFKAIELCALASGGERGLRAVFTSYGACRRCPEHNSQPRPPEPYEKLPDSHTFL